MDSTIELVLYHLLVTKFWKVASFTIFVYDYLLTFESEVELMWKSPWGIGKALFLVTRYTAFIDVPAVLWTVLAATIPVRTCTQLNIFVMSSAVLGLASAEAILFVRTCALYNNATKVSSAMILIWVSTLAAAIIIISFYLHSVQFAPSPSELIVGCYQIQGSRIIYGGFIVLLIQETSVILFTIYRATQTGIRNHGRLMHIVYRDCLLFYLCLIAITVGNIITMTIGPPELLIMTQMFQRVMHAVLASRVLLNARGVSRHKEITVADLQSVFTSFIPGAMSVDDVDG